MWSSFQLYPSKRQSEQLPAAVFNKAGSCFPWSKVPSLMNCNKVSLSGRSEKQGEWMQVHGFLLPWDKVLERDITIFTSTQPN